MPYALKATSLPPNYEAALAEACARLAAIDVAVQARRMGGTISGDRDRERLVRLCCLGAEYEVSLPDGAVTRRDGRPVGVFTRILILHALASHAGRAPSGRWIAFSDIPDGMLYAGVYGRRTQARLARALAGRGELLGRTAGRLGGGTAALGGDISAVVEVFTGVPVGIVFWEGDVEFTPAVTFLYDDTITGIFPAEDIVVMTQWLVEEMIEAVKERIP
jgi:hypothetical protein